LTDYALGSPLSARSAFLTELEEEWLELSSELKSA